MKVRRDKLSVKTFFDEKEKELGFKNISGVEGEDRFVKTNYIICPGLVLAGYKKHFSGTAIQVLGIQEISFINQLKKEALEKALNRLTGYHIPCIIVSDNLTAPRLLATLCRSKKIPLFVSNANKCELVHRILDYIERKTAPYLYIHGTLVDVYGIGILFTGKSGIGKSETALDLVQRGHRLIADDVVKVTKRSMDILMGEGKEPVDFFHAHIEIRGIGIVDLAKIFGVRATRLQKRVEIEVELIRWGEKSDIERTGLVEKTKQILGVKIPYKVIPLVPGKNISVLSEVVALEHLLKLYAIDTPLIFNKSLVKLMKRKSEEFGQLDEDNE